MPTDKTIALLKQFSHREVNGDAMAGFEARMASARAFAPEHLTGKRWSDWREGCAAAERYLATRSTHFSGVKPDGTEMKIVRKGWVARGPVVSQMERNGVTGDVFVSYVDARSVTKVRTVKCAFNGGRLRKREKSHAKARDGFYLAAVQVCTCEA